MDFTNKSSMSEGSVKEEDIKESVGHDQEAVKQDEVESAKAEMIAVKEENKRLKTLLQQIETDYKTLKTRYFHIIQQENKKEENINPEEPELVSLRLGTSSNESKKKEDNISTSSSSKTKESDDNELMHGLKLGLNCNFEEIISNSSLEVDNGVSHGDQIKGMKEEGEGEKWQPNKSQKMEKDGDDVNELADETVKRARVCVRARCDAQTMNDGCQWRKYGQKIAKGNPCPRAYYRCTISPTCPVRKQVQRCAEDMSILITTYEGTHNHPLPFAATAMASTTSAAASLLLSGSSSSQPGHQSSPLPPTLHGLNLNFSDTNLKTRPFQLPNSSSTPFSTVTLDLTNTSTPTNSFTLSNFQLSPRAPYNSLSFSSSSETNTLPTVWGNANLAYGTLPYNNNNVSSLKLGSPLQQQYYQPHTQKFNQSSTQTQQALTETLTKAITSDPSFQSVIAAAISSMVSNGSAEKVNSKGQRVYPNPKTGEQIQGTSSSTLTLNGKRCASDYVGTSLNLQTGTIEPRHTFSISDGVNSVKDQDKNE